MPTPVYQPFVDNKPVMADTGTVVIDNTRWNAEAVRDAVILGYMPGWALASTAGATIFPQLQQMIWSKGSYRIKVTLTWGTAGAALGMISSMLFEFSSDSGGQYQPFEPNSVVTMTYGGLGTLASPGYVWAEVWSA